MVERLVVRASILHRKDVVARLYFPGQSIRAADNIRNRPLALLPFYKRTQPEVLCFCIRQVSHRV